MKKGKVRNTFLFTVLLLLISLSFVMQISAEEVKVNMEDMNPHIEVSIELPILALGEEVTIIEGDLMFVIRDYVSLNARSGNINIWRSVRMFDIHDQRIWVGDIMVGIFGTSSGTQSGITDAISHVDDRPFHSDLRIRSTTIHNNNTARVEVRSNFTYTSSQGVLANGFINSIVTGNGTLLRP